MCLRLYPNGGGSGEGTHLSVYITILRGEYDALLQWPFQHKVTLILLNQESEENIVESVVPDLSSPSFFKPDTEMNVGSGFPRFAPLSVFDKHSGYVNNDTMCLKVIIDESGLD